MQDLDGPYSIVGRSLVVHDDSGAPWQCSSIVCVSTAPSPPLAQTELAEQTEQLAGVLKALARLERVPA